MDGSLLSLLNKKHCLAKHELNSPASHLTFTRSKSITETLGKGVKYVQSQQ